MIVELILVSVLSIVACHYIAKHRGARPIYWGVMGLIFGPFAIPFAFFSKPVADNEAES